MARLRRGQYLTCFYCGKRTSLRFDAATRQFDCSKCDATNYLDENGEITDPPVATERESAPTQYAVPQASSSTSHPIFCDTCIKNQRLFTASLAQYLPSDPSDPDYERLEKEYYRFRRNLETRYPQVCADCETKVGAAIKQASYTARTDHLRRMVERTRNIRQGRGGSAKTVLDWVDLAGRALWWGGLLVQLLWHLKVAIHILQVQDAEGGMRDPDAVNPVSEAAAKLQPYVGKLPSEALLLKASLAAGIFSAWWNPQFVKVARGFTRHLLGFTQWYSFQGLIVFFRFVYSSVAEVVEGQTQSAQLSAHLIMAVFMVMMYNFARRSIKVNTAPLFGPHDGTVSPKQQLSPARTTEPRNIKSFAEELDEALGSASSTPVKPTAQPAPVSYAASQPRDSPLLRRTPAPSRDFNLRSSSVPRSPRSPAMNGLSLSDTPKRPSSQQADEMDWSPTVPPPPMPRAFQPSSAKPGNRAFGASPTTSENSAFWYKVPAAPVNPAHKLRNPPNAPMIRPNLSSENSGFKGGNGKKGDIFFRGAASKARRDEGDERRGVEFRQQSFFAPREDDGDANSLADMLGASFSIESEAGDVTAAAEHAPSKQPAAASPQATVTPARAPAWELALLTALLVVYLISSLISLPQHLNVQMVALGLGGILALRIMGREQTVSPFRSALGVAELACLCTVGWNTLIGEEEPHPWAGVGALAVMVAHQGFDLITTR